MKVIVFKATFETRFNGSDKTSELEIEVDDDATEQEIEDAKDEAAQAWAANLYSVSYE
jgi:molybdopterin synthase catalytic subunit